MNFKSIRFRLISGGCLAIVILLLINGYVSITDSSRALTVFGKKQAGSLAESIAQQIDRIIRSELKTASAYASDHLLKSVSEKVNTQNKGDIVAAIEELHQELKEKFKWLGSGYLGIFVTDAKGNLYTGELADGTEYKGSNVAERSYFKAAKTSGEVSAGNIVRSKKTGKLICVVCAPIKSKKGDFLGVFGMSIQASTLTDLVTNEKIGETGYAFMTDKSGMIIAHPQQELVLQLNIGSQKGMEDIARAMISGRAGVVEYMFEGGKKVAGYAPVKTTGWSVAVTQETDEFLKGITRLRHKIVFIALLSLLLTAVMIFMVSTAIVRPINKAIGGLKDIARGEGDLTMRLAVATEDEVGELAKWFNIFIEKLQEIIGNISNTSRDVQVSIAELSDVASSLDKNAEDTLDRAHNVASSAEEMSANLSSVAAAMEESTTNSNMVASAAEQMTATINQIAKNAEEAHSVSLQAVSQAASTSEKMTELGQAAQAISKVTEAITEISEQTNLLALNATIEAARAGEAGKGFAVVANEIKELAKQTAAATMDIKRQIEGVQLTTEATVGEIDRITKIIDSVNEIVASISSAVGEQSTATEEIAHNIAQVSLGLGEVNENVNQGSAMAGTITNDIAGVDNASNEISTRSHQVKASAEQLKMLADGLQEIVNTFKI